MGLYVMATGKMSKGHTEIRVAPRAPRITSNIVPWATAAGDWQSDARWRAEVYVDTYLFEQSFHGTYTACLAWIDEKRRELRPVVQEVDRE